MARFHDDREVVPRTSFQFAGLSPNTMPPVRRITDPDGNGVQLDHNDYRGGMVLSEPTTGYGRTRFSRGYPGSSGPIPPPDVAASLALGRPTNIAGFAREGPGSYAAPLGMPRPLFPPAAARMPVPAPVARPFTPMAQPHMGLAEGGGQQPEAVPAMPGFAREGGGDEPAPGMMGGSFAREGGGSYGQQPGFDWRQSLVQALLRNLGIG